MEGGTANKSFAFVPADLQSSWYAQTSAQMPQRLRPRQQETHARKTNSATTPAPDVRMKIRAASIQEGKLDAFHLMKGVGRCSVKPWLERRGYALRGCLHKSTCTCFKKIILGMCVVIHFVDCGWHIKYRVNTDLLGEVQASFSPPRGCVAQSPNTQSAAR